MSNNRSRSEDKSFSLFVTVNETALHSTMVPVMGALAAARVTSVCMKAGLGLGL